MSKNMMPLPLRIVFTVAIIAHCVMVWSGLVDSGHVIGYVATAAIGTIFHCFYAVGLWALWSAYFRGDAP